MSKPMDTPNDEPGTAVVIDATTSDGDEFGTAVLTTIAAEIGADPATLPPLRESIDPDILNQLLDAEGASDKALSFEYLGYEVVVTDGGLIRLRSLV